MCISSVHIESQLRFDCSVQLLVLVLSTLLSFECAQNTNNQNRQQPSLKLLCGFLIAFQIRGTSCLRQLECRRPKQRRMLFYAATFMGLKTGCQTYTCGIKLLVSEDCKPVLFRTDMHLHSAMQLETRVAAPIWYLSTGFNFAHVCELKMQFHLYLCPLCSQCILDHKMVWPIGSQPSKCLGCIYTCTFTWSCIRLQSNHKKKHFNARCKGGLFFFT